MKFLYSKEDLLLNENKIKKHYLLMLVLSCILLGLSLLFFFLYIKQYFVIYKILVFVLFISLSLEILTIVLVNQEIKEENNHLKIMTKDDALTYEAKMIDHLSIMSLDKNIKVYEIKFIVNQKESIYYLESIYDKDLFQKNKLYNIKIINNIIVGYEELNEKSN